MTFQRHFELCFSHRQCERDGVFGPSLNCIPITSNLSTEDTAQPEFTSGTFWLAFDPLAAGPDYIYFFISTLNASF